MVCSFHLDKLHLDGNSRRCCYGLQSELNYKITTGSQEEKARSLPTFLNVLLFFSSFSNLSLPILIPSSTRCVYSSPVIHISAVSE